MARPRKDTQTVTPDGAPIKKMIEGVAWKALVTQVDERGELMEAFNPAWGVHEAPMVYTYQAMIRPKQWKGWVVHRKQDDRIVATLGTMQWALYDDRPDSPTYKKLDVFTVGERNRCLFTIPRGVYHLVRNVGIVDAYFLNFPTRPYDHADPDKYRLPLDNDLIPYPFPDRDV